MTMTRIDERSRRRDRYEGGVAVRLADGQEWRFCVPAVRSRVVAGGDIPAHDLAFVVDGWDTFDADYTAALGMLRATTEPMERLVATLTVAAMLLAPNYDLQPVEAFDVLDPGDGPDAPRIFREISRAAVDRPIADFLRAAEAVLPHAAPAVAKPVLH